MIIKDKNEHKINFVKILIKYNKINYYTNYYINYGSTI